MQFDVRGQSVYAYTGGQTFDASKPCVVFLHGALNDHSVWTLLARWFAHHGHSVLALDQPGHCRSAGPLLPNVEALADWTWAVLDALGVQQASLVGHSMGSLIALAAAGQAPQRATALVMVGTAYPMVVSDALLQAARDTPAQGMAMVNNLAISSMATKPGFPGPGSWLHGGGLQLMARVQASNTDANVFEHDFKVCGAYAGGLEAAAAVTCPAHLVLGDVDQMTPPKATKALAAALRARVHRVPGGHSQMQEQPEATLAAIRAALGA